MQWLQWWTDTDGSALLAVTASVAHSGHCVIPHCVEATEKKFSGLWRWQCLMILTSWLMIYFPPAPSDLFQPAYSICYYWRYDILFVDRIIIGGKHRAVRYMSSHGERSHGETSPIVHTAPELLLFCLWSSFLYSVLVVWLFCTKDYWYW
jgi:hypothetical protein